MMAANAMRQRIPSRPDRADEIHVDRVIRDWAGRISLSKSGSYEHQEARQALLTRLSDIWLILREAGYSRQELLEQLGEWPWEPATSEEAQAIRRERDQIGE